ncbi:MAG: sulfotransferase [Candidatus Promineifilaceae bacterium]
MIKAPVIIIGCPRSGTTLLYSILSEVSTLWSIGYESKAIIEAHHPPETKNWSSGALSAFDLTPASQAYMLDAFEINAAPGSFWRRVNGLRKRLRSFSGWQAIKRHGRSTQSGSAVSSAIPQQGLNSIRKMVKLYQRLTPTKATQTIRLLEKTPENCLRLPFLLALFPDARIIYLTRDGRSNINSLMEGWRQPHLFPGYQVPEPIKIPGDIRGRWAFTLIPGWRELTASPLEEVCAWQWVRCNEAVLAHREKTDGQVPYLTIRYEKLIQDPALILNEIAAFIRVDFVQELSRYAKELPKVNMVSKPEQEKWRRENGKAIERVLPIIRPTMEKLGYKM